MIFPIWYLPALVFVNAPGWGKSLCSYFKSALEPSRRDLSNAVSPVSLRSLVWELVWVGEGVIRPSPVNGVRLRPRSSAG